MGPLRQCAVIERGGRLCFACLVPLRRPRADGGRDTATATIDHWNGDGHDHDPSNLVPACRLCNQLRPYPDVYEARLVARGRTVAQATAEAARQRALPLDLAAGKQLMLRWYEDRVTSCALARARYKERRLLGQTAGVVAGVPF